jgi:hypothetical protein
MTCLSLIQEAAEEVGVNQPTAAIGSGDPNARMLLRLAQRAGENIAKRHDWSKLIVEHTFTSTATQAQADAFPAASYDRMNFMSDVWDRSRNLRYIGPSHIKDWQWLQNGAVAGASGVIGYWRVLGGQLNLFPAPPAGNTLALEYITKLWATDSCGTARTSGRFEADDDLALVPERLIALEVIWRWQKRYGLDYAESMSDAERAIELDASRDNPQNVIAVGKGRDVSTQASTWPGVIVG